MDGLFHRSSAIGGRLRNLVRPSAAYGWSTKWRPPDGNLDPQQFQQQMQERIADFFRERLAITNDEEWAVVQPRLMKVIQLRMQSMLSGLGGFRGMMGSRGGAGGDNPPNSPRGGRRGFGGMFGGMFGQASPESEALQKAIDSNASSDQVKSTLARYREARKQQQAELGRAQDQLLQLLTLRQEAVLVSMGLLE